MQTKDFKDYLKTIFPDFKYKIGFEDKSEEKSIMIYRRSGTAGYFEYGDADEQYTQLLPMTLIVNGTGNYAETEAMTMELFNHIVYLNEAEYNGFVFSCFPVYERLPQDCGKSKAGFYRFSIDVDCVF